MVDYVGITGHIGYAYRSASNFEAGMPSRIVFDDINKNGRRDAGEPADDTDLSGYYALTLRAGVHTLRVAMSSIWTAASSSTPS